MTHSRAKLGWSILTLVAVPTLGSWMVSFAASSAVIGASIGATGCGTGDASASQLAADQDIAACQRSNTKCPNDVVLASDVSTCTSLLDGTCGQATLQYNSCIANLCSDAGTADLSAIDVNCYNQQLALESCLEGPATVTTGTPTKDSGTGTSTGTGTGTGTTVTDSGSGVEPTKDASITETDSGSSTTITDAGHD